MSKRILPYRLKLFLSYVLVLVLPATVLFSVFLARADASLRRELIANETGLADAYISLLENEFATMSEIAGNLSYSSDLLPFKLFGNSTKARRLIATINRYEIGHTFFQRLYVHFYCDDYFYSSSSSILSHLFYGAFAKDGSDAQTLQTAVEEMKDFFIHPARLDGQEGLLAFYPLLWRYRPAGCVCFFVSQARMDEVLGNGQQQARQILLVDTSGVSLNGAAANWPGRADEAVCVANGRIYYRRSVADGRLQAISISCPEVFAALGKHSVTYTLLFALTLLGGTLLCAVAAQRSYSPISRLHQHIVTDPIKGVDDLAQIQQAWLRLSRQNQQIANQLKKALESQQRLLLFKLLTGDITEETEVLQQCEDIGLDLTAPLHYVILASKPVLQLRRVLAEAGYPACRHLYTVTPDRLYLMESDAETDQPPKIIADVFAAPPCHSLEELPAAYLYACSLRDLHAKEGLSSRLQLDQMQAAYQVQLARIAAAARRGNADEAVLETRRLTSTAQSLPPTLQKRLYEQVLLAVEGEAAPDALPDSHDGEQAGHALAQTVQAHVKPRPQQESAAPNYQELLAYVEQHYMHADFSLQQLAQHFGLSVSYASQIFKEQNGEGLLDYYTRMRMRKACDMLEATDMSVTDIALAVGYLRPGSFSRRFKQTVGATPAEYRSEHRGGDPVR